MLPPDPPSPRPDPPAPPPAVDGSARAAYRGRATAAAGGLRRPVLEAALPPRVRVVLVVAADHEVREGER